MQTLEPRAVERPFHWRWLKAASLLMLKFPIRFGALIATLSFVDVTVAKHLQGYTLPKALYRWIGVAVLPVIWTLVATVAKGTEHPGKGWSSLLDFVRNRIWYRALLPGLLYFAIGICLSTVFQDFSNDDLELSPEFSGWKLHLLSHKATRLNDCLTFWVLLVSTSCIADVIEHFLSYGIAEAAGLVYSGVVGYVAYKDIFERQSLEFTLAFSPRSVEQAPAELTSPDPQRAHVLHK